MDTIKLFDIITEVEVLREKAQNSEEWAEEQWHTVSVTLHAMEQNEEHYTDEQFEAMYAENDKRAEVTENFRLERAKYGEALKYLERALSILNALNN